MWQIHFTKKYYIFILRRWEYKFVFNHILVFSFIKLLVGIFKVSYGATKHMIEDMPTWWKICRQLAKVEERSRVCNLSERKSNKNMKPLKAEACRVTESVDVDEGRMGIVVAPSLVELLHRSESSRGSFFLRHYKIFSLNLPFANMWCLGCSCEESLYHCNLYRIN